MNNRVEGVVALLDQIAQRSPVERRSAQTNVTSRGPLSHFLQTSAATKSVEFGPVIETIEQCTGKKSEKKSAAHAAGLR